MEYRSANQNLMQTASITAQIDTNYELSPELIQNTPVATRDWHKEILMGLFLRSSESELSKLSRYIATEENSNPNYAKQITKSKPKLNPASSMTNPFIPGIMTKFSCSTALDILPYAIRNVNVKHETVKQNGHPTASIHLPLEWKRQSFSSQSLNDLERHVMKKFNDHFGSNQENSSKRRKIDGFSYEQNTETELRESPSQYKTISLQYNECSLAAISKWAARSIDASFVKSPKEKKLVTDSSSVFFRPSPSAFFRKCSICENWGHYEVECEQIPSKDLFNLSSSVRIQRILRDFVEEENMINSQTHQVEEMDNLGWTKVQNNCIEECKLNNTEAIAKINIKSKQNTESSLNGTNSQQNLEDDYLTKSTACLICDSGFHGEDLLLCDGCDGLFHRQCLDPPLSSVPEGDWFCASCASYDSDVSSVVEIEGCEGFVIEQRKRSMAETHAFLNEKNMRVGFSKDSWSVAVSVVKKDDLARDLTSNEELTYNEDKSRAFFSNGESASYHSQNTKSQVDLAPGDLCWAKRKTTHAGKHARDDWWPAMVVQVTDSKLGKKIRSVMHTPYIVKLYALSGAGRVRASDVLPFFPHYEEIGHKRLMFNRSQYGYNEFKRALEESTSEIGCRNLGQALKKAREISNGGKIKEHQRNNSSLRSVENVNTMDTLSNIYASTSGNCHLRPSEWEGAEASEIDGIVILANPSNFVKKPWKNGHEQSISSDWQISRNIEELTREEQDIILSARKEPLPPAHKLMGSIVAFAIKQSAQNVESTKCAENSIECFREKSHSQLQMGVVAGINNLHQKLLVRCLPSLNNISSSLATAKIQATYNEGSNEDSSISIHSCSLGPSLWVRNSSVIYVADGPTGAIQDLSDTTLSKSLRNAKEVIRARILDEATKREENTVELVSLPPSTDVSLGQNETEEQIVVSTNKERAGYRGRRMPSEQAENSVSKDTSINSSTKFQSASTNGRTTIQTKRISIDKKNKKSRTGGIFVAERILDERLSAQTNSTEYLIKWRGFRDEDSTWEPIDNIYDQSLVRLFKIEQLLTKLKALKDAFVPKSVTQNMIKNIESGLKKFGDTNAKQDKNKSRACPFCRAILRDGSAFGGHVKTHSKEPNYKLLRESYKIIMEENWAYEF